MFYLFIIHESKWESVFDITYSADCQIYYFHNVIHIKVCQYTPALQETS